jgi:hypothetical protein
MKTLYDKLFQPKGKAGWSPFYAFPIFDSRDLIKKYLPELIDETKADTKETCADICLEMENGLNNFIAEYSVLGEIER